MSRVQISSSAPFFVYDIITYVKNVAELLVLAMSMFIAAFFCLRVLFIPQNANFAIEKIHEVGQEIPERR